MKGERSVRVPMNKENESRGRALKVLLSLKTF